MGNSINVSDIYYDEALELIDNNELTNAISKIEISLNYNSKNIESLNLMGICQYLICNFDKAHYYWEQNLSYNGNTEAEQYLKYLDSNEFLDIMDEYNLAIENVENEEYVEAVERLEKVNRYDKELVEPYVIIGLCYYELKKYKLAKKYIEYAVSLDKNIDYLKYLNEINIKYSKSNKNKIIGTCIASLGIICIFITISTKAIVRKNTELEKETIVNRKLVEEYAKEVQNKNDEYNRLKEEFEKSSIKNTNLVKEEQKIFNEAIVKFKNKNYEESLKSFLYVLNNAKNGDLRAESLYYSAVCFEMKGDYREAEECYREYIGNHSKKNYYDDSLYNYGLLSYKLGKIQEAKEILKVLQEKMPDSMFVNSNVRDILNE